MPDLLSKCPSCGGNRVMNVDRGQSAYWIRCETTRVDGTLAVCCSPAASTENLAVVTWNENFLAVHPVIRVSVDSGGTQG